MVNKHKENFTSTNLVVLQVSLGTNGNWNPVFLNAKTIKYITNHTLHLVSLVDLKPIVFIKI